MYTQKQAEEMTRFSRGLALAYEELAVALKEVGRYKATNHRYTYRYGHIDSYNGGYSLPYLSNAATSELTKWLHNHEAEAAQLREELERRSAND